MPSGQRPLESSAATRTPDTSTSYRRSGLANAIATVKAVLIGLAVLGSVLVAMTLGSGAVLVVIIYGFVSVVSIYVTFGWLEQTLRLLIGIAYNTAESADLMTPEDSLVEDDVE